MSQPAKFWRRITWRSRRDGWRLPGSSIKTFTLLALLEAGKVNEQTTLMCKRALTVGGHNFDCTHPDMKQPFDPATALAYSCNSYFTTVATRLTPAELRDSLLKYGLQCAQWPRAERGHGQRCDWRARRRSCRCRRSESGACG